MRIMKFLSLFFSFWQSTPQKPNMDLSFSTLRSGGLSDLFCSDTAVWNLPGLSIVSSRLWGTYGSQFIPLWETLITVMLQNNLTPSPHCQIDSF